MEVAPAMQFGGVDAVGVDLREERGVVAFGNRNDNACPGAAISIRGVEEGEQLAAAVQLGNFGRVIGAGYIRIWGAGNRGAPREGSARVGKSDDATLQVGA